MKRVMPTLLGLLCLAGICMAQNDQSRHQVGTATQEMITDGLSAAHASIPIGSKIRVVNLTNGAEIEATVVGRIPESNYRILDLSLSAARALRLSNTGSVVVSLISNPPGLQPPPVVYSPEIEASRPRADHYMYAPAPEKAARPIPEEEEKQPYNLIINNYIMNPEKPESEQDPNTVSVRPVRRSKLDPYDDEDEEIMEPLAAVPESPPAQPPSLFTAPPVANVQVIPGLPDPHTNKTYRLLVGTYNGVDNAYTVYRQLQAAGFDVVQEQAGEMCKVFAAGIPASSVYYAAQRLGSIGFAQVWLQE